MGQPRPAMAGQQPGMWAGGAPMQPQSQPGMGAGFSQPPATNNQANDPFGAL